MTLYGQPYGVCGTPEAKRIVACGPLKPTSQMCNPAKPTPGPNEEENVSTGLPGGQLVGTLPSRTGVGAGVLVAVGWGSAHPVSGVCTGSKPLKMVASATAIAVPAISARQSRARRRGRGVRWPALGSGESGITSMCSSEPVSSILSSVYSLTGDSLACLIYVGGFIPRNSACHDDSTLSRRNVVCLTRGRNVRRYMDSLPYELRTSRKSGSRCGTRALK